MLIQQLRRTSMNTIRAPQSILSFLSRSQIRNVHILRTPSTAKTSPFLELFYRHQWRPSIRQLWTRRRFTSRTRLRDSVPHITEPPLAASRSLTQRLRDLSREYGWTAVGVYFTLSALDFPFCFLAVRWIGTDKIAALEHSVVEWVKRASPIQIPEKYRFWKKPKVEVEIGQVEEELYDHGYKEAEIANKGDGASIGTQLALAYAIHKSFIFIRVPLTAAILPKIVKTLRGWGWKIGKRKPKINKIVVKTDTSKTI